MREEPAAGEPVRDDPLREEPAREGSPEPWLNEFEQGIWRRLLAVECRLRERLDRDLEDAHGMSLGDYDLLVHLSEAEGRQLRMSDLAEQLLLSRSGLTRRVDGLVGAGLVERKPCPDDRRGSLAVLTDAGLARLEEAAPTHVAGVRRYLVGALGSLAGLDRGLAEVERALDQRVADDRAADRRTVDEGAGNESAADERSAGQQAS